MKKVYENLEETQEIFMNELKDFTQKYDFLGEITLKVEPDIDTLDFIYSFENLNGKRMDELSPVVVEISRHMREFSKQNNIYDYFVDVCFFL
ncbi:MAG: hypothetical protein IJ122_08400 [Methanobrevibacter sp.]|nr:hypothetical protein [Methanobrevibacter sp.]